MTHQQLIDAAVQEGFAAAAVVDTACIPFDFSFRPYCEENLCGQYGINYSCPPHCGSCQDMRSRILSGRQAVVLQSVWEICDYSDTAAIRQAKAAHNAAAIALTKKLRQAGIPGFMIGASGCALCTPCAAKSGQPCRFPDRMYSCMSAYCIFVKQLCDRCGLEYDSGPGLLSFFGMFVLTGETDGRKKA